MSLTLTHHEVIASLTAAALIGFLAGKAPVILQKS
jgi:hypothetical protein